MRWSICLMLIGYVTVSWSQVTYFKDIAPLVKSNCQHCHSQGEIGPMPLTTYEEVSSYASMVKFVTDAQLMPPFKADFHKVNYANQRSLSEEEKNLLAEWINTGLSKGDSLTAVQQDHVDDRKYDYTICMSESFEHYGIYYDQYQAFVLPLDLQQDKIIEEIVFEPGNREIVRSANISISPKGSADSQDKWDPRYGYYAYGSLGFDAHLPHWYSWMPHTPSLLHNEGERLFLPKDYELIMHIHYGPYGEVQKDSSCIHFNFLKDKKVRSTLQNVPLVMPSFVQDSFVIHKGIKERISTSFYIPVKSYLKSVSPLSHLLCRNWEVFAVLPDKTSIPLLSIDDWDFHWREKYIFEEPIELPPGTKIITSATYDNTGNNPYNPADPPINMKAGKHMFDENFTCYFEFLCTAESPAYFEKPYSVITGQNEGIKIIVNKDATYKFSLVNLNNLNEENLLTRNITKGSHQLKSSFIPKGTGRYAFVLSQEDRIYDIWYVVVP